MKSNFVLSSHLTAATDQSSGAWTSVRATFKVIDREGVNDGTGVAVGDSVWIDTSAAVTGTVTEYTIASIVSKTATQVVANLTFVTTDHAAPDLSWCLVDGNDIRAANTAILRKTSARGLFPTFSPSLQLLPDRLAFFAVNRNAKISDADTVVAVGSTAPANPVTGQVWVKT